MKTPQIDPIPGTSPLGMTPPTPAQQAEAFREEIRKALADIAAEIAAIHAEIRQIKSGPATAGTQAVQFSEMLIDNIIMMTDENGKLSYKGKGAPYQKHGVKIWDEVLSALGIDPAALKPGPNPQNPPIRARVLMGETTNRETGETGIGPRKVIGRM